MKKTGDTLKTVALVATIVIGIVLIMSLMVIAYNRSLEPTVVAETVEVEKPTNIDTSAIDAWCGNYCDGKLRMVGAWMYSTTINGEIVLEDETGNLWIITDTPINETDYLLLWIADNHTADNQEDDVIIKMWVEAHN